MLWRLWARIDRRFLIAGAGLAMALLLPIAGTLVVQGLDVRVEGDYVAYRADGAPLQELDAIQAVRFGLEGDVPVAAIVQGDPLVSPDGSTMPGLRTQTQAASSPLVPSDHAIVHPDTLPGPAHVALLDAPIEAPGVIVAPARGADAFEAASVTALQAQTLGLVLASAPSVALVAMVFADSEARRMARSAATLAALGRPRLARGLIALRIAWLAAAGATVATFIGWLLWLQGGVFRPEDTRPMGLVWAIIVPTASGAIAGVLWGMRRVGDGEARLRVPPSEGDLPGARLGWLPVMARPLALGTRILPVLAVAAIMFGVNLAFPIAAASVPAAIAGEPGEWVVGADAGITVGGNTASGPGVLLQGHPDVDAIVAEILIPSLMDGTPVLVRGGDLEAIAAYHDVDGPSGQGLWLGERLAARRDVDVGDVVSLQASDGPRIEWLPVAGIFAGGMLADEGLVDRSLAERLSGVAPDRATVLRVRPDTDAVRSLLATTTPDIQVTDVRVGDAVAGQYLDVTIDVVNLGGAGQRLLPVRVNTVVAAEVLADLPAWGQATYDVRVLAPDGAFQIRVNPERSVAAAPAQYSLQVPAITFLPDPIPVTTNASTATLHLDGLVASLHNGTLQPVEAGWHEVHAGDTVRRVLVSPDELRNVTSVRVDTAWIEPSHPRPGELATLHVAATNHGGRPGIQDIPVHVAGQDDNLTFRLLSGRSGIASYSWIAGPGDRILVDGNSVTTIRAPGVDDRALQQIRTATSLQVDVADRILGDAQRALVGLAIISLASILAVVYLGTERTLLGRGNVLHTLHAHLDGPQIRYRAAWEAGLLAAIAFLAGALATKLAFLIIRAMDWLTPFGHTIPDPISWFFITQAGLAFVAAAALASYLASGRLVATMH